MIRRPPRSTRTDTLFPYTTLFRSFMMVAAVFYGLTTFEGSFLAIRPVNSLSHYTDWTVARSEEHTSELQSLMRISYAVFCLKKKKKISKNDQHPIIQRIYNITDITNTNTTSSRDPQMNDIIR